MRIATRLLPILLVFIVALPAHAFDAERKGFIFGGGAGLGMTHIMSDTELGKRTTWKGAPALSFRIGFGTNNRTLIFLGAKSSLAYMDEIADAYDSYTDAMGEDNLKGLFAKMGAPVVLPILWMGGAHSTFGLVGVTYYFEDEAPCWFVEGTLGVGILPDEFRNETLDGFGLSLAGGYEFSPHYSLRLDFLYGTEEKSQDQGVGYLPDSLFDEHSSAISFLITINALAY
jgi:hypothetical protein